MKVREDIGTGKEFDAENHFSNETDRHYGNKKVTYLKNNEHPSIDDIIDWLSEMKSDGATHIDFGGKGEGEVWEVTMQPFIERDETPEEAALMEAENKRKWAEAEKCKKLREKQEYEAYLKLKQKYESNQ